MHRETWGSREREKEMDREREIERGGIGERKKSIESVSEWSVSE